MKLLRNNITVGILIASQLMYGVPAYAEKYTSEPSPQIHGRAPVASGLAFDNQMPALGDTVKLFYVFSDLDGDAEHGTAVQWLRDGQPIQGATAFSYTLSEASGDRPGQRLSAEVTPKTDPTLSEPSVGQVASLETTVAGDPTAIPQVKVTDITGTLTVGSTLTGVYSYDQNGSGSGDASTKSWLNGGHTDTDNDDTYVLAAEDVGKVLTFEVEAKNLLGVVGNTDSITTATATGVAGGSSLTPGAVVDPTAKPKVKVTDITGKLTVGSTLTGVYEYKDGGSGSSDASAKSWLNGRHGDTGNEDHYVLADDDAGLVLTFQVQAKNLLGVMGNTDSMDTATAASVTDGDGAGGVVNLNVEPSITDLKVSGTLKVGEKLVGEYSYNANGSGSSDASTYNWAQLGQSTADVGNGNTVINSGEVPAYIIKDIDAGKVLEVSVQAKNQANVVGNQLTTTTSTPGGTIDGGTDDGKVIDPEAKPSITDLKIEGEVNEGQTLKATYTFEPNHGNQEDISLYMWDWEAVTAETLANSTVAVQESGKVPERLIVNADVNKVLQVSVLPKNGLNLTGDVKTAKTDTAVQALPPEAINVRIESNAVNVSPFTGGQTLRGEYEYKHPTNVAEGRSTFQWYKNNKAIHGANQKTYKLSENADVGNTIKFGVIPASNAATQIRGVEAFSKPENVTSALRPYFLLDKRPRTWQDADRACKSVGAILPPSSGHARTVLVTGTSATSNGDVIWGANSEMCTIHGWPLDSECGGNTSEYWTDTTSLVQLLEFERASVNMRNGNVNFRQRDSNLFYVICMRGN